MAALDTFEWFVTKFYPSPDAGTRRQLEQERLYLLTIRNENERVRYIHELLQQVRESRTIKPG